ncbi:tyrosine-type recombinase/integrase [Methylobacterium nodulans]|uniref:Integrase family protein n=1 Tax=Methylobacterium nodulans (strain LMG 21967 / CNCM I-2342 / ORS 2060) TaxID=460265 RepID=B8IMY0_METNO|nr:tyrosine-type recombinase/integrase [Methylobacterium nodulans]ACL62096.1 integrase family protein [Methylobacterium nodulans ORS 2060]
MPRSRPPHLVREVTRHGRPVWYVRVGQGKRIRMREPYGSPEFWRDYRLAVEGTPPPAGKGPAPGTLSWLLAKYVESAEWSDFSAATRKQRHAIYRAIEKTAGHEPIKLIDRRAILNGRDRRRDRPHAANVFIKAMRALFSWAVDRGYVATDPTAGVKMLAGENDDVGFHTWTEEELARFEARWPLGTRERLAFDILLYTGLRRGDAVRLGRQHVKGDAFSIRTVTRPILPQLAASIAATKTGDLAFIVRMDGHPFVKEGFGNWFREACRAAKVPGSAHGLRKAGARRAAEAGATEMQLNALFGWRPGSRESATYTRTADNARLAREAPVLPAPLSKVRDASGNS